MIAETIPELTQLSPEEKFLLAGELWESALADESGENFKVDPELARQLYQSLEDYRKNPNRGVRWEELRNRLSARK